jgi:transcriptional regulator with XRE-family HTH domain
VAGGLNPVVRGRRLATALHDLRVQAGRTIDDVARHLECSAAKVSRIENGHVSVRIQDARELLDLYGVAAERRESLLELVRQARGHGWWYAYRDAVPEEWERYFGLEDEAGVIWNLEPGFVPGLLQTEEYARGVHSLLGDSSAEMVRRRVELRMLRKRVLTRAEPVNLHVVVGDLALRRPFVGPRVMAEQIRGLIDAAGEPHITVQVLPCERAAFDGMDSAFTIFGFTDPPDPKVVCESVLAGTSYHESFAITARYVRAFESACVAALDPTDSLAYLGRLVGDAG